MTGKLLDHFVKRATNTSVITVNQGDLIPCDGIAIDGFAMVDECAVSGVSTAAMIEAGTDHNQVLAGTTVVEGSLTIKCSGK